MLPASLFHWQIATPHDASLPSRVDGSLKCFEIINKKRHSERALKSSFAVPSTCRVLDLPYPPRRHGPVGPPIYQEGLSSIVSVKSSRFYATRLLSAQLVLQQHFQPFAQLAELLALERTLGAFKSGHRIVQSLLELAGHRGRGFSVGAAVRRLLYQVVKVRESLSHRTQR